MGKDEKISLENNVKTQSLLQVNIPAKKISDGFFLKNIEFQIPPGYMAGVIGGNGAGKTSLLRLLLGVYYLESGNIWVDGHSMLNHTKKAKSQMGFVMDENPFPPSLTVQECGEVCGIFYDNFSMNTYREECGRFQLPLKRKIKKLSQGMQIKLQLAFALAANVKLLIMDEPTAGLDPVFRHEFMDILCDFIEDGKHSVVLSTHLTGNLDRVADYLLYIENGTQRFFLPKEQLQETFKIVTGTPNQLQCIPKDRLIAKQITSNHSEALIYAYGSPILIALKEMPLTIEKLMYYLSKKGDEVLR